MGVDRERGKGWILCWESAAKRQESDGGGMRWSGFIQTFGKLIGLFCLVVRIRTQKLRGMGWSVGIV